MPTASAAFLFASFFSFAALLASLAFLSSSWVSCSRRFSSFYVLPFLENKEELLACDASLFPDYRSEGADEEAAHLPTDPNEGLAALQKEDGGGLQFVLMNLLGDLLDDLLLVFRGDLDV